MGDAEGGGGNDTVFSEKRFQEEALDTVSRDGTVHLRTEQGVGRRSVVIVENLAGHAYIGLVSISYVLAHLFEDINQVDLCRHPVNLGHGLEPGLEIGGVSLLGLEIIARHSIVAGLNNYMAQDLVGLFLETIDAAHGPVVDTTLLAFEHDTVGAALAPVPRIGYAVEIYLPPRIGTSRHHGVIEIADPVAVHVTTLAEHPLSDVPVVVRQGGDVEDIHALLWIMAVIMGCAGAVHNLPPIVVRHVTVTDYAVVSVTSAGVEPNTVGACHAVLLQVGAVRHGVQVPLLVVCDQLFPVKQVYLSLFGGVVSRHSPSCVHGH